MSIRRVTCPGCGAAMNVPATMASIKCPACGTIWNGNSAVTPPAAAPAQANRPAANSPAMAGAAGPRGSEPEVALPDENDATATAALIAGLVGGGVMLLAMVGLVVFLLNRPPDPSQVSAVVVEETIKPSTPEPYREINLPEETRRRIYNDYRKVARTTVETPLILPQGTKARASLEDMLQKTYDRELMHFAALHDITVDDVKEVIKEGDAKVWDDSPRSNAVRDGKRVYSKEMSEGWQRNPNRK